MQLFGLKGTSLGVSVLICILSVVTAEQVPEAAPAIYSESENLAYVDEILGYLNNDRECTMPTFQQVDELQRRLEQLKSVWGGSYENKLTTDQKLAVKHLLDEWDSFRAKFLSTSVIKSVKKRWLLSRVQEYQKEKFGRQVCTWSSKSNVDYSNIEKAGPVVKRPIAGVVVDGPISEMKNNSSPKEVESKKISVPKHDESKQAVGIDDKSCESQEKSAISETSIERDFSVARKNMLPLLSSLKARKIVEDSRVEQTMLKVDRANYCTSDEPYEDSPLSIGYGAFISAPHMHAITLEQFKDKLVDGAKVLDIGSGSGYLTSCMAHMVGPTGKVYGLEHMEELVKMSENNIRRDCPELLDSGRAKIVLADGRYGLMEEGPFDVINVAASVDRFPELLVEQLKEGGKMLVPIRKNYFTQILYAIEKLPGGRIEQDETFYVRFAPLTDVKKQMNPWV